MKLSMNKIAAVLALIIGAMAVFAGGKVLLGVMPDYYVINWLPLYNYTAGILTVFVTAVLLWRSSRYAVYAAAITFTAHAVVMGLLLTAYSTVVAADSLRAMTIRLIVWTTILILYVAGARAVRRQRQFAS